MWATIPILESDPGRPDGARSGLPPQLLLRGDGPLLSNSTSLESREEVQQHRECEELSILMCLEVLQCAHLGEGCYIFDGLRYLPRWEGVTFPLTHHGAPR